MEVDKRKQQDNDLANIKESVRRAYEYFKPNYDRYNEFRRFVFENSLTDEEVTLLMTLSKPQLEFNILEAYISRLLGEFSKQEPDIMVSADDENTADPVTIKVLEQHIRHTLCDAKSHNTRQEVYKDLLSGGFSTLKLMTEYAHPMSFDQVIEIERAYDPTLCGFDPLARYSHKGDGRFCFELFPKSKDEFMEEFPDIDISSISFNRDFAGFNWSYLNDKTEMLIVADYYKKKIQPVQIVKVRDGRVMRLSKYKKMLAEWADFAAPPGIIGKPRTTQLETISRKRCIDNQIIEEEDTDFTMLPLIFVDGHSVMIKTPKNGNVRQVTRPYVYHAKGAQRLKNFAGIALANEIENMVQHKFIIKKEALPKEEEWLQAIKDVQKPSNVVVNAFYEENPDQPIPEPIREIIKTPAPPEMVQAFTGAEGLIQNILGSYDASLGINNNQLSGIAIVEAATQSNAAAMPYIIGYLEGYQRAAEIYVDLFPKYYKTPRTIPILDEEGKRGYVKINQDEGVNMFYDANALNVVVKAGASFQVQKSRTIMMIKEIMGMSPLFEQFIGEKGLNFVLDNMEGRGIEQLKMMVDGWLKEVEQQKQMAMQAQQQEAQNNPAMMKAQNDRLKLQQEAQRDAKQYEIDMLKLKLEEAHLRADIDMSHEEAKVQREKMETERFVKSADIALQTKDHAHRHAKDIAAHHHAVNVAHQQAQQAKNQSQQKESRA